MSTFKKALSLILTLVMVFTTVAIGLTFSASAATSTVKSYADLQQEAADAGASSFVYVATEFYRADGTLLDKDDTVQEGETLTCKAYLKSNCALYKGTVVSIVFDNELFDMSDFSKNYKTYVTDTTYVKAASSMVENPMDLETYTSVAEEVNNDGAGSRYSLIKLTLNSTSKATGTLAKNQVTFDPTGDTALTTFSIKVKSSVSGNSGFAKVPSTFFYSDSTGTATFDTYPSVLAIGGTTAAAKQTIVDLLKTDGSYTFSVYKPKTVTFADAAGNAITTETVESGDNAAAVADEYLPADFYMWKDAEGNLLTNAALADVTVEDDMTFTAVTTNDTVEVTFDPNGGSFTYTKDGAETTSTEAVTLALPITGYNLDTYTATMDGVEFKTWVDADMAAVSGTVVPSTVNAVTYTAKWNADVSIMVKTLSGEWVEAFTFESGEYGKTMTKDDANALVALANKNLDNIGKLIGAADEGLTCGFRCGNDTSATFTTTLKEANLGGYNAFKTTGDAVSSSNTFTYSNMTFGRDFTALYLETGIRYTVNVYRPDATTLAYDETTPSYTTNFDFYGADGYKNSSKGYGYGMTSLGDVTTTNVLGDFTYDTTLYNMSYKDGNDAVLTGSSSIVLKPANADGGKGGTISIYVVLTGKDYRIGYIIGDTSQFYPYSSESTFKFGDEVSYEDIKKVYTKSAYGGNYFVADTKTGSYLEGDTDSFFETLADIPQAGNYFQGSQLKSIDYKNAAGEKVDFRDAGKIKIDENLLSQCKTYTYTMDDGTTLICLTSTLAKKTYRYNLWYQDTTVGNWVKIVDQQAFTGSTAVAYNSFVTATEVSDLIKTNAPESLTALTSFSTEPDGKSATIKAYAAEGKTDSAGNEDSMDLYVVYTASTRYAFVSYNNAYDESNNLNTDKFTFSQVAEGEKGEFTRTESTDADGKVTYTYTADENGDYVKSAKSGVIYEKSTPYTYGTTVYISSDARIPTKEEKDPLSGETKTVKDYPYYNSFINTFSPVSDPTYTETSKEDDDGKVTVTVTDPKGNDKYRPYRDCEFAGWKLYYVDGVYSSYDELPDRSEWHEINLASDDLALTTTTILEAQWISDSNFKFRVYDDQGKISFARTGNIFKGTSYYWDTDGNLCSKGENVIVEPVEKGQSKNLCIWLKKVTDPNGSTYYYRPITISETFLSLNVTTAYVPVILELVKSLMKKGTLDLDDLIGGLFD